MLEIEFKYYREHQSELVEKYNGKFVVIKDEEVIGVYDTQMEAYNRTSESHPVGSFLIQHCLPGADSYTQVFHNRVVYT